MEVDTRTGHSAARVFLWTGGALAPIAGAAIAFLSTFGWDRNVRSLAGPSLEGTWQLTSDDYGVVDRTDPAPTWLTFAPIDDDLQLAAVEWPGGRCRVEVGSLSLRHVEGSGPWPFADLGATDEVYGLTSLGYLPFVSDRMSLDLGVEEGVRPMSRHSRRVDYERR